MILLELFLTFFLIGLFTFGGGMSMMTMIEQEVVTKHGWLSVGELYQFIGISESTPGPIAINMATFIGNSQKGILGALCATLGVVLPSFIIILIIAKFFNKFFDNKVIRSIIDGIKPIVLGLIFATSIKIFCLNIFSTFSLNTSFAFNWKALVITTLLLLIYFGYKKIFKKKLQPVFIIILGAVLGMLICLIPA